MTKIDLQIIKIVLKSKLDNGSILLLSDDAGFADCNVDIIGGRLVGNIIINPTVKANSNTHAEPVGEWS